MARRLPVLLTLATLLAAGCLSQEPVETASTEPVPELRALPTELVAPTLAELALLGTGAGEPNIIAAPDGTVYVAAINDIYRSEDGGLTFELVEEDLPGGGDGDIVVTPEGTVHWLGLGGENGPIPYYRSEDRGDTWSEGIDLSNDTGSDREWLDAREDEPTIYAAWRGSDEDGNGVVSFTSSFDAGKTWTPLIAMTEDAIGGPLAHGPVSGTVYQAQATFATSETGMDASIRLARSADHGVTWEIVPIVTPAQSVQFGLIGFPFSIFPALSVDDEGTLYMVYAVDQGMLPISPKPVSRFGVFLTHSSDNGDTWSEPRLLSSPDHAAIMPWVAAGAKGRIAVAWYENTYGMPHDNLPDVWNVKLAELVDADTDEPQIQVVQLNEGPNHVGSICTSGTGCLLTGGDRSVLDFLEVALMPNGHPAVTWASTEYPHQGTVGNVRILSRAVSDGTPLR